MKVRWTVPGAGLSPDEDRERSVRRYAVDRVSVGHNCAEVYIRLGEAMVILPPPAAKHLTRELRRALTEWEGRYGAITGEPGAGGRNRRESVARKVIRKLYKSHKVSRRLISVNTRRRKHIPDKDE